MPKKHPYQIESNRLACSLPLVKFASRVRQGRSGEIFEGTSDMPGFLDDVRLWCQETGHTLMGHLQDPTGTTVVVRKR
jgi:TusA-related sulfurtransferase